MKIWFVLTVGIVFLFGVACGNTVQKDLNGKSQQLRLDEKKRAFQLPEIPIMLNTSELRAIYLMEHYWDNFDFADTAYIRLPDITEQAIVNFMDLLNRAPREVAERAVGILYGKAAPHLQMLWYFWETMSRYWHDPNSPMKNEEMFILMCRSVEAVPQMEEVLKGRAQFVRELAEKNRVGQPASDFVYTLASGKQGKLYDLKSEYTLLFFYNPDCHTCAGIKLMMRESQWLTGLTSSGKMKVLTIYPDEDVALWKERLSEMAKEWINGYDKNQVITHDLLYDLSSMPSFYLLDRNKKVLLKDADWGQVLQFFEK